MYHGLGLKKQTVETHTGWKQSTGDWQLYTVVIWYWANMWLNISMIRL